MVDEPLCVKREITHLGGYNGGFSYRHHAYHRFSARPIGFSTHTYDRVVYNRRQIYRLESYREYKEQRSNVILLERKTKEKNHLSIH